VNRFALGNPGCFVEEFFVARSYSVSQTYNSANIHISFETPTVLQYKIDVFHCIYAFMANVIVITSR